MKLKLKNTNTLFRKKITILMYKIIILSYFCNAINVGCNNNNMIMSNSIRNASSYTYFPHAISSYTPLEQISVFVLELNFFHSIMYVQFQVLSSYYVRYRNL